MGCQFTEAVSYAARRIAPLTMPITGAPTQASIQRRAIESREGIRATAKLTDWIGPSANKGCSGEPRPHASTGCRLLLPPLV
jgi:hypothetical protein